MCIRDSYNMEPTFQCVFDSGMMVYRITEKNLESNMNQTENKFGPSLIKTKNHNKQIEDLTELLKIS